MSMGVNLKPDSYGNPGIVQDGGGIPIGKEVLTFTGAAVTPLASIPTLAWKAVITVEGASFRYWVDGSDPTTTAGHLVNIGDVLVLGHREQLLRFRAIVVSGTANLMITYF